MRSLQRNQRGRHSNDELPIAFVGTYPPQRCGIGTFTRDLSDAVISANEGVRATVLAMNDADSAYEHPERVRFEIRQGVRGDYVRAADFVNYSDTRMVSIQHEYGIFGGKDGAYILDFLAELRKPSIATLHTVLDLPTASQRLVVQKMSERCECLVVMSHLAVDLLEKSYDIPPEITHVIPHGIPDMLADERDVNKAKFGVAGKRVLLTFGLISPAKGIEVLIRALPKLVAEFPDLIYLVVGATHPAIKRRLGEEYRHSLKREVESLDLRDHVVFRDQFVDDDELCRYLQAADIYITPYLDEAQITSGTLAYAMGSGAAPVSTPYWYAKELLAEGRGHLFGFGDAEGLGDALRMLLRNPVEMARSQRLAYAFARQMIWPKVGEDYVELIHRVLREAVVPEAAALLPRSIPDLRLDHLIRMTDDTGLLQHAAHSVPDRRFGYCVDDNARGLLVALLAQRVTGLGETIRLITTYLSYLHHSQCEDGHFRNFMDFRRNLDREPGSEDCVGRALWALGLAVELAPDEGHRLLAKRMFDRSMTLPLTFGPRGSALGILGLDNYLRSEPDNKLASETLESLAAKLIFRFEEEADETWRWFEPDLTYKNALLPLALFAFSKRTGDKTALRVACDSLAFLEEICFSDGHLQLVGNAGWHVRGGECAIADEQPIDAAAFVLAFRAAYDATGDRRYRSRMRESFEWFLGANRLGLSLYDFSTAGCHDGLGVNAVNENQGAESVVSFLIALLAMLGLASDELAREHVETDVSSTE
ncbi:MAG: glycosyltransferase [bacterium]|nr:glycosyltransferase [bacterium]